MLSFIRSRVFVFSCLTLFSSIGSSNPTFYRTICQDPKDSMFTTPRCLRSRAVCPAGQTIRAIRAACESDMIRDINWGSINAVPWNSLFVSRAVVSAPFACELAGLQTNTAGMHDIAARVTGTQAELSFSCSGERFRKKDPSCQILVEFSCE